MNEQLIVYQKENAPVLQGMRVEEREATAPGRHVMGKWEVNKAATCAAVGQRMRRCKHCQYQEVEGLDVINHRFGKWEEEKSGSCGLPGTEQRVCKACGEREERKIAALAHRFSAWAERLPSSCHQAGERVRACRRCGLSQAEALPLKRHQFGSWINQHRADCSQAGLRHRDCALCGHREEDALKPRNHAYARWEVTNPATCSQAGMRQRKCRHCDHLEYQELPLRRHQAGKWQIQVKAALDQPGVQAKTCKQCGIILQTRSYYPGKAAFAVDFCVDGVRLQALWPEVSTDWLTAAPIPLRREAAYLLPLIAKGSYQVGEVLIEVKDGFLHVSYHLSSDKKEIIKERMQVFIHGVSLTEAKMYSNRQGRKMNQDISIREALKDAEMALVFLRMDGVFYQDEPGNLPITEIGQSAAWREAFDLSPEALISLIRERFEFE